MTQATLVRRYHPARRVLMRGSRHPFSHLGARLLGDLENGPGLAPQRYAPAFEAIELENEYRVTAELPGVDADDLDVTVENGVLTVKGQRRFEDPDSSEDDEERGRFERSIRFPGDVVENDARASYKNGLLTVTVPKPEEVKPEVRSIPVETA